MQMNEEKYTDRKKNRQMKSQQWTIKTMELMCYLQIETTPPIPEKKDFSRFY